MSSSAPIPPHSSGFLALILSTKSIPCHSLHHSATAAAAATITSVFSTASCPNESPITLSYPILSSPSPAPPPPPNSAVYATELAVIVSGNHLS
ncbi:unnamed protein product [Taenia asiatica]|uniref:Uncharacterized protein n=1 Tax=Taenia asiatica TaxID=60517 RepID=A0A0R3W902_TAEAS|nr:unnamed protein product [Taenia asiatica]